MKPVAWQHRAHEDSKWCIIDGPDSLLADQLRSQGGEVRKLYAIPDGYVVVPVEPTKEMQHAVMNKFAACDECINPFEAYRIMISFVQEESE